MNKKLYRSPEMEIVSFTTTDVMLSSGNAGFQSDVYERNPYEGGND